MFSTLPPLQHRLLCLVHQRNLRYPALISNRISGVQTESRGWGAGQALGTESWRFPVPSFVGVEERMKSQTFGRRESSVKGFVNGTGSKVRGGVDVKKLE